MRLRDIAEKAQVSESAVSLALNNRPGVSSATRARILRIARESGYIPRTLVTAEQYYGSSKALRFLACVNSDIVSSHYHVAPFFTSLIHALEKQCTDMGYSLLFSSVSVDNLAEEVVRLESAGVSSALILLGTNLTPAQVQLVTEVQPKTVVLDAHFEHAGGNFIVMNNAQGAYQAANYLLGLGHRAIGYVQSPTRISNFEARKKGFTAALADRDMQLAGEDVITVGSTVEAAHRELAQTLAHRRRDLPQALFCENDYMAIGVVKALQERGIRVPEDISVIGFDDIPQATILTPELTTIHVDKETMGALAARRAAELASGEIGMGVTVIVDTKLVERGSCRRTS